MGPLSRFAVPCGLTELAGTKGAKMTLEEEVRDLVAETMNMRLDALDKGADMESILVTLASAIGVVNRGLLLVARRVDELSLAQ